MTKILLVDDSLFMRNLLKQLLLENDFDDFLEAEDGLKAIEMYKLYSPDIVLMDFTMSMLDGIDALKEIIKIDPKAKVIMCSAIGHHNLVKNAIESGARDFVIKPFFDNLVEKVNKVLGTQ
ncbi:response regulator [Lederbergia citri]|uniref:Response regulator n=1 Tax=Lederbergia citri TaxID=2833580 RepID=A0A942TDW9_9BACI|nr:response regulator [Lederbergia citri]MBS4194664.1 response regulator [Lederbergia citri]